MTNPSLETPPDSEASAHQRLLRLQAMAYDDWKHELIELHNALPGVAPEADFTPYDNENTGGNLYPRAQDKDELMRYTFAQAQAAGNVQEAGLILGVGIVFTHPFEHANGRPARQEYTKWSQGWDGQVPEYSRLGREGQRETVDFAGLATDAYGLISKVIYEEQGLARIAEQAWYLSRDPEAAKRHYGEREYHGLSDEEAAELDSLLGRPYGEDTDDTSADTIGRLGANNAAILYGLSKLAAERHLELEVIRAAAGHTQVNTPDTLAQLDGDAKRELTRYIRDYNTLHARAVIDLVGPKYGDEVLRRRDGSLVTVRDLVLTEARYFKPPAAEAEPTQ